MLALFRVVSFFPARHFTVFLVFCYPALVAFLRRRLLCYTVDRYQVFDSFLPDLDVIEAHADDSEQDQP